MEIQSLITAKSLIKTAKYLTNTLKDKNKERIEKVNRLNDVFGDSKDLANYYIEPCFQNINPADESEYSPYLARQPIFSFINRYLGSYSGYYKGDNFVILLADAGMGKTSLLKIIKLNHIFSFNNPGYECVLLKLDKDTIKSIEKIPSPSKTVLLLDSLDEDPTCWLEGGSAESRLSQLINKTNNFRKIIITCRTQFFPDEQNSIQKIKDKVVIQGYKCQLSYLSLFDDEQTKKFIIKRYFNYYQKKIIWLSKYRLFDLVTDLNTIIKYKEYVKIVKSSGTLAFRPFLLNHVEEIRNSGISGNLYQIFNLLLDSWINRESTKLLSKYEIPLESEELKKGCILLAYKMFTENKRSLSIGEISASLGLVKTIHFFDIKALIKGINLVDISSNSFLNKNSDNEYRFSHLSIMEFLVIYGIEIGIIKLKLDTFYPFTDLMFEMMALCDMGEQKQNYLPILKNGMKIKQGYTLIEKTISEPNFKKDEYISDSIIASCQFKDSEQQINCINHIVIKNTNFNNVTLHLNTHADQKVAIIEFEQCTFTNTKIILSDNLDVTINKSIIFKSDIFGVTEDLKLNNVTLPFLKNGECIFPTYINFEFYMDEPGLFHSSLKESQKNLNDYIKKISDSFEYESKWITLSVNTILFPFREFKVSDKNSSFKLIDIPKNVYSLERYINSVLQLSNDRKNKDMYSFFQNKRPKS